MSHSRIGLWDAKMVSGRLPSNANMRGATLTVDHDRIDLDVAINTTVDAAWALVGEPGWFINDGQLTSHTVEWQGEARVRVTDPTHGAFTFEVEELEPPRYAAIRGLDADQKGGSRLVEFWVTGRAGGVGVRVVESGFASMQASIEEQIAQYEQNTKTWKRQLDLARERLESAASPPEK